MQARMLSAALNMSKQGCHKQPASSRLLIHGRLHVRQALPSKLFISMRQMSKYAQQADALTHACTDSGTAQRKTPASSAEGTCRTLVCLSKMHTQQRHAVAAHFPRSGSVVHEEAT